MLTLRKSLFAAAVALAATPATAPAGNMHGSPFMSQPPAPRLGPYLFANHNNRQLPAFQAAPWYLYWPYDGHFMTPAPVHAPFYGPPAGGNFPVNPYFPAPGGYYGPYPGGPAPGYAGPGGFGSYPPGGFGAYPAAPPAAVIPAPAYPGSVPPVAVPQPLPPQGGSGVAIPPKP